MHGKTSENFIVWVEEPDSNYMYHHEYFILQKKQVRRSCNNVTIMLQDWSQCSAGFVHDSVIKGRDNPASDICSIYGHIYFRL